MENHLRGITGPGAPHSFSFDRRGDLPGALIDQVWFHGFCYFLQRGYSGEIQESIQRSRFWEAYNFDTSDDDVILRLLGLKVYIASV